MYACVVSVRISFHSCLSANKVVFILFIFYLKQTKTTIKQTNIVIYILYFLNIFVNFFCNI